MQKKVEKKCFVFEINAFGLFATNCCTNKRIHVIGSQCVKKKS